jgi:hypothetical protein
MGDNVSNSRGLQVSKKGIYNEVQFSDLGGENLDSHSNVYINDTGCLHATCFIGDGGTLSNVSSESGGSNVISGTIGKLSYYSSELQVSSAEGLTYDASTESITIGGNLTVVGNVYSSNNIVTKDTFIEIAEEAPYGTDMGIIMQRPSGNVAIGYQGSENNLVISYTDSSAHGTTLVPDNSKNIPVEIYGNVHINTLEPFNSLTTTGYVGIGINTPNANLHVNGNVYALNYEGDGGTLSNVVDNEDLANVTARGATTGEEIAFTNPETSLRASGNVVVTGNVTASIFYGDGGTLSNVVDNEDLANVTARGATTGEEIAFTNPETSLRASGNVVVTGNVTASIFYGDGGTLSNVVDNEDLANVTARGATTGEEIAFTNPETSLRASGNVVVTGNVTASTFLGDGGTLSNVVDNEDLANVTARGATTGEEIAFTNPETSLRASGNVVVTGNVTASTFLGDGGTLSNVVDNEDLANVTARGATTGEEIAFTNPETSLRASGNVVVTGNVTASTFLGDGGTLSNVVDNEDLANVTARGATTGEEIAFTNPETSLRASGNVVVTGNVTASTFLGDGGTLSNVVDNEDLANVTARGATTGEEIAFTNPETSLRASGNVVVSGNVTASTFLGDGGTLSNVVDNEDLANVTARGATTGEEIAFTNPETSLRASGNVVVSGNVTASTFLGDGGTLSNVVDNEDLANVTARGATTGEEIAFTNPETSLRASGNVVVTGNVTASIFYGDGGALSNVVDNEDLANVTARGATTGEEIAFTNPETSLRASGNVVVTGNVTASIFYGDGGALSNVVDNEDLANVTARGATTGEEIAFTNPETSLRASGNVVVTGNVTASMFFGDGGVLSNISGGGGGGSQTLQQVSDLGNTTSNTIQFTNTDTSIVLSGAASFTSSTVIINSDLSTSGVAIGYDCASTSQGNNCIAIGNQTGQTSQGNSSVAIGDQAGQISQGIQAVAIGDQAGQISQGIQAVAIGKEAGYDSQGRQSVAIGYFAGQTSQNTQSVAIGHRAGQTSQNTQSVAIGYFAGQLNQDSHSVAIGYRAGFDTQATNSVAIGYEAGENSQFPFSIAIGRLAGNISQNTLSIAIGTSAGETSQGIQSVAIGYQAGQLNQDSHSVAIGYLAGQTSQTTQSVAIGYLAGQLNQDSYSVAIGRQAGYDSQGSLSVAIGNLTGQIEQGLNSIAIGNQAGYGSQGAGAVAVGAATGQTEQGIYSVAIGYLAGQLNQDPYSIAIGLNAGQTSQGSSSVAIGRQAGETNQHDNSIILNASGVELNSAQASSFFVGPIRSNAATNALYYNSLTKEISYDTKVYIYLHTPDAESITTGTRVVQGWSSGISSSIFSVAASGEITINRTGYVKLTATCGWYYPGVTVRGVCDWHGQTNRTGSYVDITGATTSSYNRNSVGTSLVSSSFSSIFNHTSGDSIRLTASLFAAVTGALVSSSRTSIIIETL